MANEDANVDGHEWDVMAAHAQAASADRMCEGAQAVLDRATTLGADVRKNVSAWKAATTGDEKFARTWTPRRGSDARAAHLEIREV